MGPGITLIAKGRREGVNAAVACVAKEQAAVIADGGLIVDELTVILLIGMNGAITCIALRPNQQQKVFAAWVLVHCVGELAG